MHTIGALLYSLPFLAVIVLSLFFVWAGNVEMIVTGVALFPPLLHLFGIRWARYLVGVIAAISFLLCSMVPIVRGSEGGYFWVIWLPIWLVFGFSAFVSFLPIQQKQMSVEGAEMSNVKTG